MSSNKQELLGTAMPDAAVAEFLRNHPDFFVKHPDVLMEVALQHSSGPAVSLIERQVALLREHNRKLKRQLQDLVQIARDNDRLSERMHRLTLALIDCTSLEEVFIALHDNLRNEFQADAVTLRLLARPLQSTAGEQDELSSMDILFADKDDAAWGTLKGIMNNGKPVCGILNTTQLNYLFGDQATDIASAALIPMANPSSADRAALPLGIVAIGSYDAERFHPGMGTHFLSQMGELISRAIRPYLS